MRNTILFLPWLLAAAAGCSKIISPQESPGDVSLSPVKVNRRVFQSPTTLEDEVSLVGRQMEAAEDEHQLIRSKRANDWPLFANFNEAEAEEDPILKVDCNIDAPSGKAGDYPASLSYYERAGYDTLVPNKAFAALLNKRGEFQVGDTIYKISPTGTYAFHKSEYDNFLENYGDFEKSVGLRPAEDNTRLEVCKGIFNYPTFAQNSWKPQEETSYPMTPGYPVESDEGGPYHIAGYDWGQSKVYSMTAGTWLGKLLEGLFGCNTRHHAYFNDKSRLRAGLYDYDYIVYRECGATATFQRKMSIYWLQFPADELFLGWKNIILKTSYKTPIPNELKNNTRLLAKDVNGELPFVGSTGTTAYILGIEIPAAQIKKLVGYTANQLYNFLKGKLGSTVNLSAQACYNLFTDKEVYTIIPGWFKLKRNHDRFVKIFDKSWAFSMPNINLLNLPSWESYAMRTLKSLFGSKPSSSLVHAEVGAAGYADGVCRGMRFEKK